MTRTTSLLSVSNAQPAIRIAGFAELDERLIEGSPGVLVVRAPVDVHLAVLGHVARRLRTSGWSPIVARSRSGAPLFREIATQLGLGALATDPPSCADLIATSAQRCRSAFVAPLPAEGSWDFEVAAQLTFAPDLLLVLVTTGDAPARWGASTFELSPDLDPNDRLRWLAAAAHDAHSSSKVDMGTNLGTLEAWWDGAVRRVNVPAEPVLDGLDADQRELLTILALAGRSVSASALSAIHPATTVAIIDELATAGLLTTTSTHLALSTKVDGSMLETSATPALRTIAARALAGTGFEPCPWAYARAAELLLEAGDIDAADDMMTRASRSTDDVRAASEISARWQRAVAPIEGDNGFTLRRRAAERALANGEAHEAQRWCESLSEVRPKSPEVGWLLGRSLLLLGDLVAARVALQRAMAVAEDREIKSGIAATLAEVSYVAGDLKIAAEHAVRSVETSQTASGKLEGRNILGKIHLAAARWDEAEEHFTQDAFTAAEHGDKTAELRARLNRAIAQMSRGRLDEARSMLERILDEGGRFGEDRASSYALRNLAVIAYRQHDYGRALSLWEAAVKFPSALCGRITSAFTLANLAEFRLRLGLLDHAEHTLAFGLRVLGGHTAAATIANFGIVAARLALARGDISLARREIDIALSHAEAAGDRGDRLPDACLVAARVALEEGDFRRAGELVERAKTLANNDRLRAEVAIVRVLERRAAGEPAIDAATHALAMARAADEEDLLAEIHALLAVVHRDGGRPGAAAEHCRRAIGIRDQVVSGLPAEIRAAFLAKPEMVALSRLQVSLSEEAKEEEAATPSSRPPPSLLRASQPPSFAMEPSPGSKPPAPPREIVGDDPRIKSLLVAVRKVARSTSTVLIRGESGTGKELVAEALHRESHRARGPLVSVNCAALVETLLLSELFGHEKGAFTGAASRKRGRFELAEGGTLFLDEIGDISPRTQVALLRVLQEKTFERVGGTSPLTADVRIICATHRDLKAMVERGEFREDLYYRLQGVTLEVPSLRERIRDLPKLAEHLLGRIASERSEAPRTLTAEALDLLSRHRWPGNIRELENVLRAVSLFAEGASITLADVVENVVDLRLLAQAGPISLRAPTSQGNSDESQEQLIATPPTPNATDVAYAHVRRGTISLSDMKRQIEQECVTRALSETNGNITRAAVLLGMKRPRLSQLAKQYGLSASNESDLDAFATDSEEDQ